MKKISTSLVLLMAAFFAQAQLNIYSALTIPDSMRKDADIVVRDEYIKISIKDKNTAWYTVHRVFTVMNEKAKRYLYFQQYSDKFHALDDAEIKVYDMLGNKKGSYSKKDMNSGKYGDELVPEGKYTYYNINSSQYPMTVEYNYNIRFKGIFNLPDYNMQSGWQSIQHSVFEVEVPADLGVRYKLLNSNKNPQITHSGGKDIYQWEQKDVPAFKIEKYSGASDKYLPQVLLAPNKFQLDDYEGDMTSWKNFGVWMNDLYAKVSGLPEDKKQFYRDMVKNATTDKEKAAILYRYMQNNMRYVSIQLGIGGWRPFPAAFVDEKKYGDCKALSNYLKTTLDAVGIRSNIIIIYRDYEPRVVDEKFPMNDFNHAILCIPQPADTIWLECTSTSLPFASLDETTLSRKAIMITENGGVLVNTPSSNFKDNTQSINTVIEVNEDGGAKVKASCSMSGDAREVMLMRYHDLKEDEKKKFFIGRMQWKHPDQVEITNSKDKANPYVLTAQMDYEKIFSFNAGNKLFFETKLYPIFDEEVPDYEKRIHDYYFDYPYQVMDTTVYKFPAGFTLETMPKNKQVQFAFARYSCNYNWDAAAHTLTITAVLQVKERVIKAADYTMLVDFRKQIMADVNEKIVMKKQ